MARPLSRLLLLHLELGIDNILVALAVTGTGTAARRLLEAVASGLPAHLCRHRLGGSLQVADRLTDRLGIVAAGGLLGPLDGRLDRRAIPGADLVGVLLELLLDRKD